MAVRELHRPIRCWGEPDSSAPRIELTHFNVFAVLIRFGAVEERAFDAEAPGCYSSRQDAVGDVCRVLPVMAKRGGWILCCRHSMHECRRAKRRLGNRAAIEIESDLLRQLNVVGSRELHKQVVRVLGVDNRTALERLSCLEELWKPTPRRSPGFSREHPARHKTTRPRLTLRHEHEPVLGLGFVNSARCALMIKADLEVSVTHDHPVALHPVPHITWRC